MTLTKARPAQRATPARPDFYHLFWAFLCASVVGVFIETVFMLLAWGVLMNRSGVLYGPFSLVWGAGAVLFTLLLYRLQPYGAWALFFGGAAVGTALEYFCSWLQEALFGLRFWSYDHMPLNLNGRVCLLFSFFWGLAALVWMRLGWPALCALLDRPRRPSRRMTRVLAVLLVLDIALTAAALLRMDQRQQGAPPGNAVEAFLDRRYPDERLLRHFTDVKYIR